MYEKDRLSLCHTVSRYVTFSLQQSGVTKSPRARPYLHLVLLVRPISKPKVSLRASNPPNLVRAHSQMLGVASSRLVIRRLRTTAPLLRTRPVQCLVVLTATCRQRGLPTAGHFPEMATRPPSGMMGASRITKASPAGARGGYKLFIGGNYSEKRN